MFVCSILTNEVRRKYLPLLVNGMSRCTFFLVSESSFFTTDLVHGFCRYTLQECVKKGMIEHLPAVCALSMFCKLEPYIVWLILILFFPWLQIARKICSSVDLSWGGSTQLLLHVLETVTDSVVCVKVISYSCYWKSVVISLLCTFQLL
jgi:separase